MIIENFHEAGHVRALEIMWQEHIHVERGDSVLLAFCPVLDPYRVANILDADLVDGDLAGVGAGLYVFDLG